MQSLQAQMGASNVRQAAGKLTNVYLWCSPYSIYDAVETGVLYKCYFREVDIDYKKSPSIAAPTPIPTPSPVPAPAPVSPQPTNHFVVNATSPYPQLEPNIVTASNSVILSQQRFSGYLDIALRAPYYAQTLSGVGTQDINALIALTGGNLSRVQNRPATITFWCSPRYTNQGFGSVSIVSGCRLRSVDLNNLCPQTRSYPQTVLSFREHGLFHSRLAFKPRFRLQPARA